MKSYDKLCVQWNDFKESVTSSFAELRGDTEFADVTLACEDGQQIKAHTVILISGSPFFRNLLKMKNHPHPLIYMRGVKFEHLLALIDFIYLGQANVHQDNIESFLATAHDLKLAGFEEVDLLGRDKLAGNPNRSKEKPKNDTQRISSPQAPNPTRILLSPKKNVEDEENDKTTLLAKVKSETLVADMENLDEQISSMISDTEKTDLKHGKVMSCKVCGKEGARIHIAMHVEAMHITGASHPCDACGKKSRSGRSTFYIGTKIKQKITLDFNY